MAERSRKQSGRDSGAVGSGRHWRIVGWREGFLYPVRYVTCYCTDTYTIRIPYTRPSPGEPREGASVIDPSTTSPAGAAEDPSPAATICALAVIMPSRTRRWADGSRITTPRPPSSSSSPPIMAARLQRDCSATIAPLPRPCPHRPLAYAGIGGQLFVRHARRLLPEDHIHEMAATG